VPRTGLVAAAAAGLSAVLIALVATSPAIAAPSSLSLGSSIEALAPYQGQTHCDAVAQPGVAAFRDLVLKTYPGTGDSGIVRACHVGGASEHKDGRAWDWRVNTANAAQVAQVDDLMTWLLSTDEHDNTRSMARRLGVTYMIWDSRIWKSYQADKGWQPYTGASPHTDHVHFSFAWAGAYNKTSYWTGRASPVMYAPVQPCPTASATPTPTASRSATPSPTSSPSATASPRPCAAPAPGVTPSADASLLATPTPSASPTPSPVVYDLDAHLDRRRTAADSMPGPWRRH
jgi:hypothetical protein